VRAAPSGINTNTGSASAALQGYTTAGPAQPGQTGYLNTSVAGRTGNNASSGGNGATGSGTRQLAGAGGIIRVIDVIARDLEKVGQVAHPAKEASERLLHGGIKALAEAKNVAFAGAVFIGQLEQKQAQIEIERNEAEEKFGASIARAAVEHPDVVALVVGLVLLADPPGALALTVLAMTAGGASATKNFREGHYGDAAVDAASVIIGGGGAAAKILSDAADTQRAVSAARAARLGEEAAESTAKPNEVPALTSKQRTDLNTLIQNFRDDSTRAELLRSTERRREFAAAYLSLVSTTDAYVGRSHPHP
jgi:hypothetical protein